MKLYVLLFASVLISISTIAPVSFGASDSSGGPAIVVCNQTLVAGPTDYATPVVLVNSPYEGSASASTTQTYTTAFNFGGFASSEQGTITSASVSNGAAMGVFEIDEWNMYHWACSNGTNYYFAKVVGTTGIYCSYNLEPSGALSDRNEPTQVSVCGYSSITFQNGYTSETGSVNTCGANGFGIGTQVTTVNGWSLSVSIGTYTSVSGSASITSSTTYAYQYNFPSNGQWLYQALGSGGNSGWSFNWVGC